MLRTCPKTCAKASDCSWFETDRRKFRDSCESGMITIHYLSVCIYWQLFLYWQLSVTGFSYFCILEERPKCERLEPNKPCAAAGRAHLDHSKAGSLSDLKKF